MVRRSIVSLLAIAMFVTFSSASANATVQGYFDGIDCSHMWGWAWDSSNPARQFTINISVDGVHIGSPAATSYRPDLPGGGYHAFNYYSLPAVMTDGRSHSVSGGVDLLFDLMGNSSVQSLAPSSWVTAKIADDDSLPHGPDIFGRIAAAKLYVPI